MQAAKNFEMQRENKIEASKKKKQEDLKKANESKGDARKSYMQSTKALEKLIREEQKKQNPYVKDIQKALNLKATDFSIADKEMAEHLLEKERMKIKSNFIAQQNLNQVQIYQDKVSKLFEENENLNIDVKVPIFEEEEETPVNDKDQ